MLPNWQSRSSFETVIDELVACGEPDEGNPRSNPVSINSLEAAWDLAAERRGPQNALAHDEHAHKLLADVYGAESGGRQDAILDPNRIIGELGLHGGAREADVAMLKREFALRNHPDRVPDELRAIATQRMMLANALIDDYVAKLRKAGA